MQVNVRLFAVARQLSGIDAHVLQLPDGATVADLRRQLAADLPLLAGPLPHCLIAIDARYADDTEKIPPDAEIACIPPVSGG